MVGSEAEKTYIICIIFERNIMSQVNLLNAFPMPIIYGNLGEQCIDLNNRMISKIYELMETDENLPKSGVGVFQTRENLEVYDSSFYQLANLMKQVFMTQKDNLKLNINDVNVRSLWANIIVDNPWAYNMPHGHTMSYKFSFVYFPTSGIVDGKKLPFEGTSEIASNHHPPAGNLVILDPLQNIKAYITPGPNEYGEHLKFPYWGSPINIGPQEGMYVIFPAYAFHMVTPTERSDYTRMTIAGHFGF